MVLLATLFLQCFLVRLTLNGATQYLSATQRVYPQWLSLTVMSCAYILVRHKPNKQQTSSQPWRHGRLYSAVHFACYSSCLWYSCFLPTFLLWIYAVRHPGQRLSLELAITDSFSSLLLHWATQSKPLMHWKRKAGSCRKGNCTVLEQFVLWMHHDFLHFLFKKTSWCHQTADPSVLSDCLRTTCIHFSLFSSVWLRISTVPMMTRQVLVWLLTVWGVASGVTLNCQLLPFNAASPVLSVGRCVFTSPLVV